MQTALELIAGNSAIDGGRICASAGYLHGLVLIGKVRMIVLQAVVCPRLRIAMRWLQVVLMLLLAHISHVIYLECVHV